MLTPVASAAGRFIACRRPFAAASMKIPAQTRPMPMVPIRFIHSPANRLPPSAISAGEEPRATG